MCTVYDSIIYTLYGNIMLVEITEKLSKIVLRLGLICCPIFYKIDPHIVTFFNCMTHHIFTKDIVGGVA